MAVRLLRYVARIHDRLLQENAQRVSLPVVYPLVLYHGSRPWRGPTRLSRLYAGSAELTRVLGLCPAELEFALIDLSKFSDAALKLRATKGASMAMLTALLLKHSKSQDMRQELLSWRDLLARVAREADGLRALELFICYALGATTATEKELVEIVVPITQPEIATMIKTTGQKLREEGMAKGLAQGRTAGLAEGRMEAFRESLRRLLEARFGKLTLEQEQVINQAEAASLEALFDQALTAASTREVLGR